MRINTCRSIFLLFLIFSCVGKSPENIPAAIVNGDTIWTSEMESELKKRINRKSRKEPFWEMPKGKEVAQYRRNILRMLTARTIVYQEAEKRGIVIDSSLLQEEMKQVFKARFAGDSTRYYSFLDRKYYTPREYEDVIYQQMVLEAVKDSLVVPFSVPEDSMRLYYEGGKHLFVEGKMKVSHICLYKNLSYSQGPERKLRRLKKILQKKDGTLKGVKLERAMEKEIAKKRKTIFKIRKRLAAGENFEKLVREFSEDTASVRRNGFVKEIPWGYRQPEYHNTAFSLHKGEISDVVETKYGFFIIRADSEPTKKQNAYEDVKGYIRKKMNSRRRKQLFQNFIRNNKPVILLDSASFYRDFEE